MLDCQLEPRDFLTMDFEMASSYNIIKRNVRLRLPSKIVEENLKDGGGVELEGSHQLV